MPTYTFENESGVRAEANKPIGTRLLSTVEPHGNVSPSQRVFACIPERNCPTKKNKCGEVITGWRTEVGTVNFLNNK